MKSSILFLTSLIFLFACNDSNFCENVDCIANTYCDEEKQECICIDGWEIGTDGQCQPESEDFQGFPGGWGAYENPNNDPCYNLPLNWCGINGYCDSNTGDCICEDGWSLGSNGNCYLVDISEANYLGIYIQSNDNCSDGQSYPNLTTVTVVKEEGNSQVIILQGFGGINGGHDVKANVNSLKFSFEPNPQTITNSEGVEATFTDIFYGTARGKLNVSSEETTIEVKYTYLVDGLETTCNATLVKQ